MSRDLYRVREQVFWKQHEIMTDETRELTDEDREWVLANGRGNFTGAGGGAGSNSLGPIPGSTTSSSAGSSAGDQPSTDQNSNGGGSGSGGASDSVSDRSEQDLGEGETTAPHPEIHAKRDFECDAGDVTDSGFGSLKRGERRKSGRKRRKGTANTSGTESDPDSPRKGLATRSTSTDRRRKDSSISRESPPESPNQDDSVFELDTQLVNSDLSPHLGGRKKRRAPRKGYISPRRDRFRRSKARDALTDEPSGSVETRGAASVTASSDCVRTLRSHQRSDATLAETENGVHSPRPQTTTRHVDSTCSRQLQETPPRNGELESTLKQEEVVVPQKYDSDVAAMGLTRQLFAAEIQKENEPVRTRSTRKPSERTQRSICNDAVAQQTTQDTFSHQPRKTSTKTKRSRRRETDCVANDKQAYITDFLRRKTPLRGRRSDRRTEPDGRDVTADSRLQCPKTFANGREFHPENAACPNCKVQHDKRAVLSPDSREDDLDGLSPSRRLRVRACCSSGRSLHVSKPNCCGSLIAKFLLK